MENTIQKIEEKTLSTISGWYTLIGAIIVLLFFGYNAYQEFFTHEGNGVIGTVWTVFGAVISILLIAGNGMNQPNQGRVYSDFGGEYAGTLKATGFYAVPFWWGMHSERTLAIQSIEIKPLTVADANGNPIIIGGVINCVEKNTAQATYGIDDLETHLNQQGRTAFMKAGKLHPLYAKTAEEESLTKNTDEVAEKLIGFVAAAYEQAGYVVSSASISTLQYAPEIAPAMLQVQQAKATVEARELIVQGGVEIVKHTIDKLKKEDIELTPADISKLTINLLTVIAGHSPATPVLNIAAN